MPLPKTFREIVQERAQVDSEYREGLLKEAVQCYLDGEPEVGRVLLRDYVNATVGFQQLAERTHHSAKSLMRMLSPTGNPRSNNLFEIFRQLQEHEGVRLEVAAVR